jgi:hypothetical protein
MEIPQNGWFIYNGKTMKRIKMDDLGVLPSQQTSMCMCLYIH